MAGPASIQPERRRDYMKEIPRELLGWNTDLLCFAERIWQSYPSEADSSVSVTLYGPAPNCSQEQLPEVQFLPYLRIRRLHWNEF